MEEGDYMALTNPYYRIIRPKKPDRDYVLDSRYANDRIQMGRAYKSIEDSLTQIFNYIEPGDGNKEVYSFELYTLLLRACTEVEQNFKLILSANKYSKNSDCFKMKDYMKIEKSSKLSKYVVHYPNWRGTNGEHYDFSIYPFREFGASQPQAPSWYQDYNRVKHNREKRLPLANFGNCINAVAGLLVVLYSQFGEHCIQTYGCNGLIWVDEDSYDEDIDANIIFTIDPPTISDWGEAESYDFDWNSLKYSNNPICKFDFDSV